LRGTHDSRFISKGNCGFRALVFFVVIGQFVPLAMGPETALLKRIAPGVVWVAALLSVLLTLPRLFAKRLSGDGTFGTIDAHRFPYPVMVAGITGGIGCEVDCRWRC
jgi:heme exporter protein CcmB